MRLERNAPYWLLVAGVTLFIGGTLAAPWARAQGWSGATYLYQFYAPACHQLPARSFHLWGEPLAACHRCVGLYGGFLLGLLVMPLWPRWRDRLLDQPRRIVLFAVPMAIDWLLFSYNVAASRFLTGFVASFPLSALAWAAASDLYQRALHSWEKHYERS